MIALEASAIPCEKDLQTSKIRDQTSRHLTRQNFFKTSEFNLALYLTLRRLGYGVDLKGIDNRQARRSSQLKQFEINLLDVLDHWTFKKEMVLKTFLDAQSDLAKATPSPQHLLIQLNASNTSVIGAAIKVALRATLTHCQKLIDEAPRATVPNSIFVIPPPFQISFENDTDYSLWVESLEIWKRSKESEKWALKFDQSLRQFQAEFGNFLNTDQSFESLRSKAFEVLEACTDFSIRKFPLIDLVEIRRNHILNSDTLKNPVTQLTLYHLEEIKQRLNGIQDAYADFYPHFKNLDYAQLGRPIPFLFYQQEIEALLHLIHIQTPPQYYSADDLKDAILEFDRLNLLRSETEDLFDMAQLYNDDAQHLLQDEIMTDYFVGRYSPEYILDYLSLLKNPHVDIKFKTKLASKLTTANPSCFKTRHTFDL